MNRGASLLGAALALALLAGCGDLDTSYATRGQASVNGVDVLHSQLAGALPLSGFTRLSPRAAGRDLLIHVARATELPEDPACTWISDWLEEEDGRQFVLVLRDGTLAPWLCRRWAAEAAAEAVRQPARQAELQAAGERLTQRALREDLDDAALAAPGVTRRCALFAVTGRDDAHVAQIAGWWEGQAPLPMRLRAVPSAADAEPLITADGQPWAIAIPFGGSRLVVVAGATALLDAAQVDHRSRDLTGALIAGLVGFGAPARAGWIEHLAVRSNDDPEPPNILAMLFGKPPFNWVAFHLLALVVVFLAWKATWLGRTEAPRDRRVERFARHVDALALHLRQARALRAVVEAIARAVGRKPAAAPPVTTAEAFAQVQDLYRPESRGRPPPQEPP